MEQKIDIEDRLRQQVGTTVLKTYKVRDILPNPYRHMGFYPTVPEKVDRLRESYRASGYWSNILGREHKSKFQQAYGHHRKEALLEEFGPDAEVSVLVAGIDDATMLRVMCHENMEEWGASLSVMMETVRSVVLAYAKGTIELPVDTERKTEKVRMERNAPSFVCTPGPGVQKPYTAQQVSRFLGLPLKPNGDAPSKVEQALSTLELIEAGVLTETQLAALKPQQFRVVVEEARKDWVKAQREAAAADKEAKEAVDKAAAAKTTAEKAKAEKEAAEKKKKAKATREQGTKRARKTAGATAGAYKGKDKTTEKEARKAAEKARGRRAPTPKSAEKLGREVYDALVKLFQDDGFKDKLDAMLDPEFIDYIPTETKKSLATALTGAAKRVQHYADRFKKATEPRMKTVETLRRQLA